MGYYAGTSTGPNDLLDKLRIALLAEGWTVNDHSAVGAGYRLHVQKDSEDSGDATVMYFNFRSAVAETGVTLITEDNEAGDNGEVTGLVVNGSTGYDAGELWHVQTGYPVRVIYQPGESFGNVMSPMSTTAIPAYYFFFNGDSVHIVVEITAGKFQFMSFGMLVKQGVYTGGQYFTASMSSQRPWYDYQGDYNYDDARYFVNKPYSQNGVNGAVYVNVDSVASWRNSGMESLDTTYQIVFPCPSPGAYGGNIHLQGITYPFWAKAPNAYNAMAAMCPLYTFLRRSDGNLSLLGWPEGARMLNVTNYSSGEEITYGDETWVVFHADSLEETPTNMHIGFAFLKET